MEALRTSTRLLLQSAAQSPVASAVKDLVETECKSYSDHATQSKQSKFIRTRALF